MTKIFTRNLFCYILIECKLMIQNINFLLLDDKFLQQKFANEINANYSTSLPLPIHPSSQPASQPSSYRQVASGITAALVMAPQSGWWGKGLYSSINVVMWFMHNIYSIEQMHCPLHLYKIDTGNVLLEKCFDLFHPLLSWTTLLSHEFLVHRVYGDLYHMGEILEFSAVRYSLI